MKNKMRTEKWNNLSFGVELCCFPVQCLEECSRNKIEMEAAAMFSDVY